MLQSEQKTNRCLDNNPGNVRKHAGKKSNKCRMKTKSSIVQTNICTSLPSTKIRDPQGCQTETNVFKVGDCRLEDANKSFIQTWDISCLTPDHMKKHFKICMERSCCKVMISDQPIYTNLCRYCKPAKGKSIDFYQFLTCANVASSTFADA